MCADSSKRCIRYTILVFAWVELSVPGVVAPHEFVRTTEAGAGKVQSLYGQCEANHPREQKYVRISGYISDGGVADLISVRRQDHPCSLDELALRPGKVMRRGERSCGRGDGLLCQEGLCDLHFYAFARLCRADCMSRRARRP